MRNIYLFQSFVMGRWCY